VTGLTGLNTPNAKAAAAPGPYVSAGHASHDCSASSPRCMRQAMALISAALRRVSKA